MKYIVSLKDGTFDLINNLLHISYDDLGYIHFHCNGLCTYAYDIKEIEYFKAVSTMEYCKLCDCDELNQINE